MNDRMWPVLVTGSSALLALILILGLTAYRRTEAIYRVLLETQERFRQHQQTLDDIENDMYQASVLVRDFLLDTSRPASDDYKKQLIDLRSSIDKNIRRLAASAVPQDKDTVATLEKELDEYWSSLNPIFEWSLFEKLERSNTFLRRIRGRRTAIVTIAREIAKLNYANFDLQRANTREIQQNFLQDLQRMAVVTFLVGLFVMSASIFRTWKLERRAESQHRQTEEAEHAMRELSLKLVQAQEDERRRVSRELHDEVGQLVTALRLELGNLERLRESAGAEYQRRLHEAKVLAEQTLRTVRDMAMGLRPSMLDDLGLAPALEWQAREFSRRSGVSAIVSIEGSLDELDDAHRTCVYRVVQEALTNCARHANATHVRIVLHGTPAALSVTIQDDGAGMIEPSDRHGLGLLGMEERVKELGGRLEIDSQPEQGTQLKIELPLRAEAHA
jgi:signal transduction histidine kinase